MPYDMSSWERRRERCAMLLHPELTLCKWWQVGERSHKHCNTTREADETLRVQGALRPIRNVCDGDGRSVDDGLTVSPIDGVGAHAVCMAASVVSCYSAACVAS
ncbi:surface protease GP63 [Trypanosoma cruzi]|nr:surface protease GP63 [Trypanosoma cruzi]